MYREGYDYYVLKCMDFELEPVSFYTYIKQLSSDQLHAFNEYAEQKRAVDLEN